MPKDPLAVANQVRDEFKRRTLPRAELARLYLAYAPVPDIERFLDRAEQFFPNYNCGLASVYLQSFLGGAIRKGTYSGMQHTFLELPDGTIVDVTADQFGGPRVYVGPLVDPWA